MTLARSRRNRRDIARQGRRVNANFYAAPMPLAMNSYAIPISPFASRPGPGG